MGGREVRGGREGCKRKGGRGKGEGDEGGKGTKN